jgi:hypothetical protein
MGKPGTKGVGKCDEIFEKAYSYHYQERGRGKP